MAVILLFLRHFVASENRNARSTMMNLRSVLLLALFVSLSIVFDSVAAEEIDCAKDCADFVASVAQKEKASLESELSKCKESNDALQKEHDDTVASLKKELSQLQAHQQKAASLEKELRDLNKEIEQKYKIETDQQRQMLAKASELAKKSQEEVIEAKLEIQKLVESMGSTRINFKLIGEDIAALWKKLMSKVMKKDDDEATSDL